MIRSIAVAAESRDHLPRLERRVTIVLGDVGLESPTIPVLHRGADPSHRPVDEQVLVDLALLVPPGAALDPAQRADLLGGW